MTLTVDVIFKNSHSQPLAPRNKKKNHIKRPKIIVNEVSDNKNDNIVNKDLDLSCRSDFQFVMNFIEKNKYSLKTIDTKQDLFNYYCKTYTNWLPHNGEALNMTFDDIIAIAQHLCYLRLYGKDKIIWINNTIYPKNKHVRFN